jgi:hypothetical protein
MGIPLSDLRTGSVACCARGIIDNAIVEEVLWD